MNQSNTTSAPARLVTEADIDRWLAGGAFYPTGISKDEADSNKKNNDQKAA